jgi:hypothetical protein
MLPRLINQITQDVIESLQINEVREGRNLDYKLELPGNSDADKRDFLADVAALANSGGGDIVYGIEEKPDESGKNTGAPGRIAGIPDLNVDQTKLRLMQLIRSSIEPVIQGVEMEAVGSFEHGPVFIVRIPKSWSSPHMVTFKGLSRFYARSSAGNHPLDVDEIRAAFLASDSLPRRFESFRQERVARILAGETPIGAIQSPKMIVHAAPLSTLGSSMRLEARLLDEVSQRELRFPYYSFRFNFDGVVGDDKGRSYVQVFRTGMMEAASGYFTDHREDQLVIFSERYESEVIRTVFRMNAVFRGLEHTPPVFIGITLTDVKGAMMGPIDPWRYEYYKDNVIDRPILFLPDVQLDSFDQSIEELARTLRPAFDTVWQAAGLERSNNYDEQGAWAGKPLNAR